MEPIKEAQIAKNTGIIEISDLEDSEDDSKVIPEKGVKKKIMIGKGQKVLTDFFKKI